MSNRNSDHYLLRGGGEMGELIREKHWGETVLGDPSEWPQSLRITLGILLNSKFPMFLWWGNELTCFYNDAYRPSLGKDGKHPSILGMPAKEAWTEIWDTIKPLIDKVVNARESVWFEDMLVPIYRNGKMEDVYWTFSYSPVIDDTDNVAGVLVTCTETTEKVNALRKIDESNQRFRNTMKQAPVGITILRGPQYIVEMANDAYLQLVDKKEAEFVGKPLFSSMPEVEETVHSLLDNVLNTGTPYHGNEVPVPIHRFGKQAIFYFDFLYHPLKEDNGTISGVIVAVTEVTEKVATRNTIEERKRLYETVTQNTPDLVYVFDLNYKFAYANEALLKMWGRSWDDSIGKSLLEIGYEPWHAEMHEREIDEVIATKKTIRGEVSFPHATLGKRIYDYIFVPVIDKNGKVEAISGITRDITQQVDAHKQIEESEMRFRNMVEQAPVAICVLRGENYIVEVANEKQLKLWGKTKEQVLDLPMFTAIPEGRGQGFEELLNGVFTTGKAFIATEMPSTLTRNGHKETYYSNFTYEPLYNSENKITGIISIVSEVTEQVVARKKIEESEQDLRNMALQAPIGICILDAATLVCEIVNDRFIEIAGKPREAIAGKYYWDTFAEAGSYYESALNKVRTEGTLFFANETELTLIRHGKEDKIYVTFVYAPLNNDEGNVKKVAVWVLDNTQQVMARRKIEEDTQKLNIVIDASELGTWELNLSTKEAIYSKRYLEILGGYKTDIKLDHSQLLKHLHPDDLPIRHKAFKEALEKGYLHYQARLIWYDNSIHWMEGKGKVFYDEQNKPVKLMGTIRDITEAKNYEEELKKSEEQFKLLADQAPMWVWLTDEQVNVLYTNPEMLNYLGITHYTEFAGNIWEQKVHPEDISMVYKTFGDAATFQQSFSFEFRVLNVKTQLYEWFYLKAVPRLEAGECTGFIGTGININEQKTFASALELQVRERTKELKVSNAELERMNKELQSFAYISSHDLQEPLRKIQTFATRISLKEENNLSDSGKDMFKRMQDAAKRMQTLIQDLLAYSRTNTTDQKIETTNLYDIIAEVKEDLSEELIEKHATIEATQLCDVNIIPFQFRQLMHNLIGNSLKFSHPAQPPLIKIKGEVANGLKFNNNKLLPQKKYCHITVSDNGIGFEQAYSEKIFEVFQRLHGKNEYIGTGIGLSIVKKIVENHNGIITASGEPNKGATFEIYIPV